MLLQCTNGTTVADRYRRRRKPRDLYQSLPKKILFSLAYARSSADDIVVMMHGRRQLGDRSSKTSVQTSVSIHERYHAFGQKTQRSTRKNLNITPRVLLHKVATAQGRHFNNPPTISHAPPYVPQHAREGSLRRQPKNSRMRVSFRQKKGKKATLARDQRIHNHRTIHH